MKTTNKQFLVWLLILVAVCVSGGTLAGCTGQKTDQTALTDEQKKQVLIDNVIMTKDGLKFTCSREDLLRQGITSEEYEDYLRQMREGGEFFKASLDSLGPDERSYFFFDLSKVDTTGMDKRLIIVDSTHGDTLDMSNPHKISN